MTAGNVAEVVGCDRTTVQRLKKKAKEKPLLQNAAAIAAQKRLANETNQVVIELACLKEREPQIQEKMWSMFNGLSELFERVIEITAAEDISPRQLPSIAKAAADLATAYADFAERVNG